MRFLFFLFIFVLNFLLGVDFQLFARYDFDNKEAQSYKNEIFYHINSFSNKVSLFAKQWPDGKPSSRLQLGYTDFCFGGHGFALQFPENSAAQILYLHGFGDIPSSPELKVAFTIWLPENWNRSVQIYLHNPVVKRNLSAPLTPIPGKWSFVKHIINGNNYFNSGDIVNNFGIKIASGEAMDWVIDNLVLWQGEDPEAPAQVKNVKAHYNGKSIRISWDATTDNLFVVGYRIYRGTIPNFTVDASTCIGETNELFYEDFHLMRTDYFYSICAIDPDENLSQASVSVQSKNTSSMP